MVDAKSFIREIALMADVKVNGSRKWDVKVHNDRFYKRVIANGSLGLGESYMDGDWDCDQLDEFFYKVLIAGIDKKIKITPQVAFLAISSILTNQQSRNRSKRVIDVHYNLGNDLYEIMLGKTMQYTCAYWKNSKNLDEAQEEKLKLVCEKLKLKPGMTVLELGGGFGYLAKYLAEKYKVKVVSYNISGEQVKYARQICKGLDVDIREQDYREASGVYDRVVSIGMMEHVGAKNYRKFMELIDRSLKEGGIALVHSIGSNESSISKGDAWITKYIFPGGHLPSVAQICKSSEKLFVVEDVHNFGPDYDKTLLAWKANVDKNWNKLKGKYGNLYEGKFKRLWDYYLLCCAGGFRSRNIQLWQVLLTKKHPGKYEAVR